MVSEYRATKPGHAPRLFDKRVLFGTCALFALVAPAHASTLLDFTTTGSLSAWSKTGMGGTTNTSVSLTLNANHFSLTPASGQYMAQIMPNGISSPADSLLHLTGGTVNSAFNAIYNANLSTNFGVLSETIALTPGTYTFYWSYAADDYTPYLDGALFALSNASHSVNQVDVLAAVGPVPHPGTTVVLSDYGATQWAAYSFNIAASDTYYVSFASYNWKDYGQASTLFIGDAAGTVTTPPATTPIDTDAGYYNASDLGATVEADFQGGTLRIDASGTINSAFAVEAYAGNTIDSYGHNGVFSGNLTGAGGLTIGDSVGGGKVTFTGTNGYTGGTTITSGGTLQIGNGGTAGSITGNVVDNGALVFNHSNAITFAGNIGGSGRVVQNGSGTLTLSGTNAFTGGIIVNSGTLSVGSDANLGSGGILALENGTTLILTASGTFAHDVTVNGDPTFNIASGNTVNWSGAISGNGDVVLTGGGTLILTNTNTYTGGTTVSAGTLQIGDGSTTGSIAGDVLNNGTLAFNRSDAVTFDGAITGSGSLVKLGGSSLWLTADNAYTGGTTINGGTVHMGNGGTTGSIAGDVALNGGDLEFNRANTLTVSGAITGDGALIVTGGGTLVLTSTGNTWSRGTYVDSSTLRAGADNAFSPNTDVALIGTAVLDLNNYNATVSTFSGEGTLALGTGTLTVSSGASFSGAITGSGGIHLISNTAALDGDTSGYSGTVTVDAGAKLWRSGNSASTGFNIVNNGSVEFWPNTQTHIVSSAISGSGTVLVSALNSLTITGANTYTGGTTISWGTLQIGNGGTAGSITGNVVDNGRLAFNRSNAVTFGGVISGTGSLLQSGSGTLILTGANTYSGGTTISAGTLQIGNGGATGSITGNIVDNSALAFNRTGTTTYGNTISGSGTLAVTGAGTLILNGQNTYTGATSVTNATLIVGDAAHASASVTSNVTAGAGAIVGGFGTIRGNLSAAGGTVSPGNSIGTLAVTGNYTQSATSALALEISPAENDKLAVTGSATLSGALNLSLASGSYSTKVYTLLTASSISGTFSTVSYTGTTSDKVYGVYYAPAEVDLAMAPKTAGEVYGDVITASLDTAVTLNETAMSHLDTVKQHGWNFWKKAIGGASLTTGSDTLSDFNTQKWGAIGGVDYVFDGGYKVSGVVGYSRNRLGLSGKDTNAKTDGYYYSLAAHLPVDDLMIDVSAFAMTNIVGVTRDTGYTYNAKGKANNFVSGGSVQIGYPLGDVMPFARLTVASLDVGSIRETEGGPLALSVDSASRTSVRGTWGVEVHHSFITDGGTEIEPRVTIAMENDFGKGSRDLRMTMAGTPFVGPAVEPDEFSAVVGTGLTAGLGGGVELDITASGRVSKNQKEGILSLGFHYDF